MACFAENCIPLLLGYLSPGRLPPLRGHSGWLERGTFRIAWKRVQTYLEGSLSPPPPQAATPPAGTGLRRGKCSWTVGGQIKKVEPHVIIMGDLIQGADLVPRHAVNGAFVAVH